MHSSLWIAAGLAVCAAIVTFTQLPGRTGSDVPAGAHGRHNGHHRTGHHPHDAIADVTATADAAAS